VGPTSWGTKIHKQRDKEQPTTTERWRWEWWCWWLQGDTVRFPRRDIPRVTAALAQHRWRLQDLGARLCADTSVQDTDPIRSTVRIGPVCGAVVTSRRKDARYCSRKCQLAARDRRRTKA